MIGQGQMAPGQPQAMPSGGAGGATAPAPNAGSQMAALAELGVVAQQLAHIGAALPVGSEAARAVREALSKLARFVGGGQSPGVSSAAQAQILNRLRQMIPQTQLAAARQPAAQPAMPPGAPGGMPPR